MDQDGIEIDTPEIELPVPIPPWLQRRIPGSYDAVIRMIFALDLAAGFGTRDGWANTVAVMFLGTLTFGSIRKMLFGESD